MNTSKWDLASSRWPSALYSTPVLLAMLCGCSTESDLRAQRINLLDAEIKTLQATKSLLTQTPNPESLSDFSMFISTDTLNAILAGCDSTDLPIGGSDHIHLASARVAFVAGFPSVQMKAQAIRVGAGITLDVTINASLELELTPDGQRAIGRVHVTRLVPVAHWGPFDFGISGFVRDLLQDETAKTLSAKLPSFSIPVQFTSMFQSPATASPVSVSDVGGAISGSLNVGAISFNSTLQIDRILFLADGIHVFASLKLS